ncbi:capsular polysaccharide export protein, LipB/KpsS family [Vibrio mediterranei]|uniref:capsular polysaccharide export protein, LipB/KpsS family n=1 Tax=Vibrio mediterranei TaxID=689 RepID=UPI004067FEEB
MRHFLFLQGPLSPFYRDLSTALMTKGYNCSRVSFNGGDASMPFVGTSHNYTETIERWDVFFTELVDDFSITDIIVYGDCRIYHRMAIEHAKTKGIKVWVFEEGYLRPNFITLENDGVNANSSFKPDMDVEVEKQPTSDASPLASSAIYSRALWCAWYYFFKAIKHYQFPSYKHHREGNIVYEAFSWAKAILSKPLYIVKDKYTENKIKKLAKDHPLFFIPLQVHNDSQIIDHSAFIDVENVVAYVISSFAVMAPSDAILVIKHHPMDRGHKNYKTQISQMIATLSLKNRVFYGHEYSIPNILRLATGCVTVNSTVGISSLIHSVPVRTLGTAIYSNENLVSNKSLDDFWMGPGKVDSKARNIILSQLKNETQLQGSFYISDIELVENIVSRFEAEGADAAPEAKNETVLDSTSVASSLP